MPAGAKEATIALTGGGGGGGMADAGSSTSGKGGSGNTVNVTLGDVSSLIGQTLSLSIGCGGGGGANNSSASGGDSALGTGGQSNYEGGGGGGATLLCVGNSACTTPIVVAAGGGGGGAIWRCCAGQNPIGGVGGNAGTGTPNGSNGANSSQGGVRGCGGGGATQAANGAAGDGCSDGLPGGAGSGPVPGTAGNGGYGAGNSDCTGGGGGGGGYRGGGGAECGDNSVLSESGGGGGAGSAFVTTSYSPGTAAYTAAGGSYTGCGRATSDCTTVQSSGAGNGGQCACTNNSGYRGGAGWASITWKVSYSQVTFTTNIGSPQTAYTGFGFQVALKDYAGNTVNNESVGTISTTINPGSGCAGTWHVAPSSSYNGVSLVTFSGAQIAAGCANTSTVTVTVANPSTGQNAVGTSAAFTVNKKNQTVSFTSSNPGTVNANDTYTPTATATSGLTPTFSVTGPCSYSNPTVTFTGSGTCVVRADQAGDAGWNAAPQVTQNVTVRGLSSTAMVCSPNSITIGVGQQTSTCTVTVTDVSPGPKVNPTGTVTVGQAPSGGTLTDGCVTPGLAASGGDAATCQFTFTSTTPQSYSFSGTYPTSSTFMGSSVSGVTVSFKNGTSTGVACTPAKTAYNNTATCVITVTDIGVTPATPSGTVTYSKTEGDGTENPAPNGSCTLSGVSSSAAQCQFTYTSPTKDTYKFSASYPGDSVHNSSGPSEGSFSITNRATQITGSCSPATIVAGNTTTCTFTVSDTDLEAPGSKVDPAGNVSVTVSGGASAQSSTCTLSPDVPGTAKCSIVFNSGPANGPLKVVSMYFQGGTGGDQHRSAAGFTSFNVSGTPISSRRTTSSTISCASSNVPVGNNQSCTVTVTDTDTGTAITPTGIVNLYTSGGATPSVGTCSLSEQSVGVATCSLNITSQLPKASKATNAFYTGSLVHHTSGTPGSYIWYAT